MVLCSRREGFMRSILLEGTIGWRGRRAKRERRVVRRVLVTIWAWRLSLRNEVAQRSLGAWGNPYLRPIIRRRRRARARLRGICWEVWAKRTRNRLYQWLEVGGFGKLNTRVGILEQCLKLSFVSFFGSVSLGKRFFMSLRYQCFCFCKSPGYTVWSLEIVICFCIWSKVFGGTGFFFCFLVLLTGEILCLIAIFSLQFVS